MNGNNFVSSEPVVNGDINNSPLFINMQSDFSTSPTFTKRNVNNENGEKEKILKNQIKIKNLLLKGLEIGFAINARI